MNLWAEKSPLNMEVIRIWSPDPDSGITIGFALAEACTLRVFFFHNFRRLLVHRSSWVPFLPFRVLPPKRPFRTVNKRPSRLKICPICFLVLFVISCSASAFFHPIKNVITWELVCRTAWSPTLFSIHNLVRTNSVGSMEANDTKRSLKDSEWII